MTPKELLEAVDELKTFQEKVELTKHLYDSQDGLEDPEEKVKLLSIIALIHTHIIGAMLRENRRLERAVQDFRSASPFPKRNQKSPPLKHNPFRTALKRSKHG